MNRAGFSLWLREGDEGKYVKMYSDGKWAPMYPQNAPTPTFIFTTKFNLDKERKGVAYGSVLLPSEELLPEGETYNSVTIGVATGAVNTISVTIGNDLKISVKVGGPFYYHSGNNDSGENSRRTKPPNWTLGTVSNSSGTPRRILYKHTSSRTARNCSSTQANSM